MNLPADKYILQDYRDDLRVVEAPQYIDSSSALVPVKVVGAGLPKPNSKQVLKTYLVLKNNSTTSTQIATVTSSRNVYFVGAIVAFDAAGSKEFILADAASGVPANADAATNLFISSTPAPPSQVTIWPPFPVKCINGLRAQVTAASGQNCIATIYYIEEIV
jgi:hypothetical protein